MMNIKAIIKEEVQKNIKEFYNDESDILDKYYQQKHGGYQSPKKRKKTNMGEYVGTVEKNTAGKSVYKPTTVYKNPPSLNDYDYGVRGVLLENGDLYLMSESILLHDDLIHFLKEKRIIPQSASTAYHTDYPKEYVAVERYNYDDIFIPSDLYLSFPTYYRELFKKVNKENRPYELMGYLMDDMDEQLDMNRGHTYIPKDINPNRNFERGF